MTNANPKTSEVLETSEVSYRLIVYEGARIASHLPTREFLLAKGVVTLGRAPDNDVVIADPRASRYHARLAQEGEGWRLTDLGSTNGTQVNERRIEAAILNHDDTIGIGGWRLVFHITSPYQGEGWGGGDTVEITLSEISGPRLIVYTGTEAREVALTGEPVTIGRSPECGIVLDHEKVSRHHAEIRCEGAAFVVADLGSTNGTWVNGRRIEQHTLQDRDTLEIGSVRLVFRAGQRGKGAEEQRSKGAEIKPSPLRRKRRRPVIFIPGMSGSELWRGDKLIWPNYIGLIAEMDAMALPGGQDLEARGLIKEVSVIPGLFRLEVYSRCLDYLVENMGYKRGRDLIELPWDWRLDFRLASQQLAETVRAWKQKHDRPAEKFVLIAHSMGGLVARYYIERLGGQAHVGRLIVMGTPHLGTPKSFVSLFSGAEGLPFDIMKDKARQIALSFPAVYQGLPAYPAVFDADGQPVDILSDERWLPQKYRPLLRQARVFRAELGPRAIVPTVCIFGYGLKTLEHVIVRGRGETWWDGDVEVEMGDGDGTIPTCSAVLEGAEIHPVHQNHGALYVDEDVRVRLRYELIERM
jgi:pSer/pThr/pTyr-binding forkhead associated (FHA) protein